MSLAMCEYRVATPRPDTFFCRHARVHAEHSLVDATLCRRCEQRAQSCDAPRNVPAVPLPPTPTAAGSSWQYISTEQLIRDTRELASRLPNNLAAIAGIPRSGLLPASYLALLLHRPLWELSVEHGLRPLGCGQRLQAECMEDGPLLVIDDSVYGGVAMSKAREWMARSDIRQPVLYAAVYPRPAFRESLDFYGRVAPEPHLFEWNLFNCQQTATFAFDLDGVLCQDWTGSDGDGPEYQAFLENAAPKWLPRRGLIPLIVTARLERYRSQTETWLRRHGVRVRELVMGPWSSAGQRRLAYRAGEFKGQTYAASRCQLFIESDEAQAEAIFEVARKPVLCPTTGRVFP